MQNLGKYLKQLRNENNLSMQTVFRETGITNSRLSKAENGAWNNLKLQELKKLADLYETPVIPLYLKAGLMDEADIEEYCSGFRNVDLLNEEDKQHVQSEIDYIVKRKG